MAFSLNIILIQKIFNYSLYTKNANSIDISYSNGYHLGLGLAYTFKN